jgi:hypothetical protein
MDLGKIKGKIMEPVKKNLKKALPKKGDKATKKEISHLFTAIEQMEELSEEEDFPKENATGKRKRKARQATVSKALSCDPWQLVAHTNLSARKATFAAKVKTKTKIVQITSYKSLLKMPSTITINHTSIRQRKVVKINLDSDTVPQIIKTVLKDYNSIDFLTQIPSPQEE